MNSTGMNSLNKVTHGATDVLKNRGLFEDRLSDEKVDERSVEGAHELNEPEPDTRADDNAIKSNVPATRVDDMRWKLVARTH